MKNGETEAQNITMSFQGHTVSQAVEPGIEPELLSPSLVFSPLDYAAPWNVCIYVTCDSRSCKISSGKYLQLELKTRKESPGCATWSVAVCFLHPYAREIIRLSCALHCSFLGPFSFFHIVHFPSGLLAGINFYHPEPMLLSCC